MALDRLPDKTKVNATAQTMMRVHKLPKVIASPPAHETVQHALDQSYDPIATGPSAARKCELEAS